MYAIKEIFHTLQGEGANAGRAAVFCRFAGCNLWSGREADRAAAVCRFCDTDFVGMDGPGGGRFASAGKLAHACAAARDQSAEKQETAVTGVPPPLWGRTGGGESRTANVGTPPTPIPSPQGGGESSSRTLIVLTGGEPMLQVDAALIGALHNAGFEIAIETNGTIPVPREIDWICVSPKARAPLAQRTGDELKLVYPQDDLAPEDMAGLAFTHRFLQPMDGPDRARNTERAVAYCKSHPEWRLSLQTHKLIGIA